MNWLKPLIEGYVIYITNKELSYLIKKIWAHIKDLEHPILELLRLNYPYTWTNWRWYESYNLLEKFKIQKDFDEYLWQTTYRQNYTIEIKHTNLIKTGDASDISKISIKKAGLEIKWVLANNL